MTTTWYFTASRVSFLPQGGRWRATPREIDTRPNSRHVFAGTAGTPNIHRGTGNIVERTSVDTLRGMRDFWWEPAVGTMVASNFEDEAGNREELRDAFLPFV